VGRLAITIGIRLLEVIFVFGIIGSLLVVILAGYEDVKEVFAKEKETED
jgi:type II secretory pathway pseudopilin PulG